MTLFAALSLQVALYQVSVRWVRCLPLTSFRFRVTTDTLVSLAGRFPLLGLVRDLHPLDNTHASQTKKCPPDCSKGHSVKGGGDLLSRLRSTIGAGGLNFSVRNGKRWNPAAIAALVFLHIISDGVWLTVGDRNTLRISSAAALVKLRTQVFFFCDNSRAISSARL